MNPHYAHGQDIVGPGQSGQYGHLHFPYLPHQKPISTFLHFSYWRAQRLPQIRALRLWKQSCVSIDHRRIGIVGADARVSLMFNCTHLSTLRSVQNKARVRRKKKNQAAASKMRIRLELAISTLLNSICIFGWYSL